MTITDSRPSVGLQAAPNYVAKKFDRLQSDLISKARLWAVDEVGAAMGHRLNEPFTALLLYLHELKDSCENGKGAVTLPNSIREIIKKALHETKRVCDIMDRTGHPFEAPIDTVDALARGREAIDAWSCSVGADDISPAMARLHAGRRLLTPREHEVLALITAGSSNKEGGQKLGISTRTFEVHRAHVMNKLGARNAADLVRISLSEPR